VVEKPLSSVPSYIASRPRIVIGMTESDCHTVSIHLLKLFLEERNIAVLNLGACVSLERMFDAARKFAAHAIAFGAQNGHAYDDLVGLQYYKKYYGAGCPVFVGGNLTVGAEKHCNVEKLFLDIGVDYVVSNFESFLTTFLRMHRRSNTSTVIGRQSTPEARSLVKLLPAYRP
jgi:methylaspartate mutase sigma subunit